MVLGIYVHNVSGDYLLMHTITPEGCVVGIRQGGLYKGNKIVYCISDFLSLHTFVKY